MVSIPADGSKINKDPPSVILNSNKADIRRVSDHAKKQKTGNMI